MKKETNQILINYYKWVVSLSIFVITASISLISAIDGLRFSNMLKWGIVLLLISVFMNWLIVKKLVIYSLIESEKIESKMTKFFLKTLPNLKIYGLLQNFSFILGLVLTVLSFILGENIIRSRWGF